MSCNMFDDSYAKPLSKEEIAQFDDKYLNITPLLTAYLYSDLKRFEKLLENGKDVTESLEEFVKELAPNCKSINMPPATFLPSGRVILPSELEKKYFNAMNFIKEHQKISSPLCIIDFLFHFGSKKFLNSAFISMNENRHNDLLFEKLMQCVADYTKFADLIPNLIQRYIINIEHEVGFITSNLGDEKLLSLVIKRLKESNIIQKFSLVIDVMQSQAAFDDETSISKGIIVAEKDSKETLEERKMECDIKEKFISTAYSAIHKISLQLGQVLNVAVRFGLVKRLKFIFKHFPCNQGELIPSLLKVMLENNNYACAEVLFEIDGYINRLDNSPDRRNIYYSLITDLVCQNLVAPIELLFKNRLTFVHDVSLLHTAISRSSKRINELLIKAGANYFGIYPDILNPFSISYLGRSRGEVLANSLEVISAVTTVLHHDFMKQFSKIVLQNVNKEAIQSVRGLTEIQEEIKNLLDKFDITIDAIGLLTSETLFPKDTADSIDIKNLLSSIDKLVQSPEDFIRNSSELKELTDKKLSFEEYNDKLSVLKKTLSPEAYRNKLKELGVALSSKDFSEKLNNLKIKLSKALRTKLNYMRKIHSGIVTNIQIDEATNVKIAETQTDRYATAFVNKSLTVLLERLSRHGIILDKSLLSQEQIKELRDSLYSTCLSRLNTYYPYFDNEVYTLGPWLEIIMEEEARNAKRCAVALQDGNAEHSQIIRAKSAAKFAQNETGLSDKEMDLSSLPLIVLKIVYDYRRKGPVHAECIPSSISNETDQNQNMQTDMVLATLWYYQASSCYRQYKVKTNQNTFAANTEYEQFSREITRRLKRLKLVTAPSLPASMASDAGNGLGLGGRASTAPMDTSTDNELGLSDPVSAAGHMLTAGSSAGAAGAGSAAYTSGTTDNFDLATGYESSPMLSRPGTTFAYSENLTASFGTTFGNNEKPSQNGQRKRPHQNIESDLLQKFSSLVKELDENALSKKTIDEKVKVILEFCNEYDINLSDDKVKTSIDSIKNKVARKLMLERLPGLYSYDKVRRLEHR